MFSVDMFIHGPKVSWAGSSAGQERVPVRENLARASTLPLLSEAVVPSLM